MKTEQLKMHHIKSDMMHFLSSDHNVTALLVAALTRGSVSTRISFPGG
jgi:hypothetical protein